MDVEVEDEELDEKSEPSTEDTQKWPIGRSRASGAKRIFDRDKIVLYLLVVVRVFVCAC